MVWFGGGQGRGQPAGGEGKGELLGSRRRRPVEGFGLLLQPVKGRQSLHAGVVDLDGFDGQELDFGRVAAVGVGVGADLHGGIEENGNQPGTAAVDSQLGPVVLAGEFHKTAAGAGKGGVLGEGGGGLGEAEAILVPDRGGHGPHRAVAGGGIGGGKGCLATRLGGGLQLS